jgi:hypothetical protein
MNGQHADQLNANDRPTSLPTDLKFLTAWAQLTAVLLNSGRDNRAYLF